MKKLLFILAITLSSVCQAWNYINISIWELNNSNNLSNIPFHRGDTIKVGFKTWPGSTFTTNTGHIQIDDAIGTLFMMYSTDVASIDTVPSYYSTFSPDSLKFIFLVVPATASFGQATFYCTDDLSNPFHVKFMIVDSIVNNTGVDELFNNKQVKSVNYYNLIGQKENSPMEGEPYIKEIIFSDNSITRRKEVK